MILTFIINEENKIACNRLINKFVSYYIIIVNKLDLEEGPGLLGLLLDSPLHQICQ